MRDHAAYGMTVSFYICDFSAQSESEMQRQAIYHPSRNAGLDFGESSARTYLPAFCRESELVELLKTSSNKELSVPTGGLPK